MTSHSIEFICKAINAIASRKHDAETELCLSDAIEQELLVISASVALQDRYGIARPTPEMGACIA
jgi:hypothetical protein